MRKLLFIIAGGFLLTSCQKEEIKPISTVQSQSQSDETCNERRDRIIKQVTDSITIHYDWRLSMDYYNYIIYRDSMRNIYDSQLDSREISEAEWNSRLAKMDMWWRDYQNKKTLEKFQAIEDELNRLWKLGILYDCPQIPIEVQNY
jgi:hypothetical protein